MADAANSPAVAAAGAPKHRAASITVELIAPADNNDDDGAARHLHHATSAHASIGRPRRQSLTARSTDSTSTPIGALSTAPPSARDGQSRESLDDSKSPTGENRLPNSAPDVIRTEVEAENPVAAEAVPAAAIVERESKTPDPFDVEPIDLPVRALSSSGSRLFPAAGSRKVSIAGSGTGSPSNRATNRRQSSIASATAPVVPTTDAQGAPLEILAVAASPNNAALAPAGRDAFASPVDLGGGTGGSSGTYKGAHDADDDDDNAADGDEAQQVILSLRRPTGYVRPQIGTDDEEDDEVPDGDGAAKSGGTPNRRKIGSPMRKPRGSDASDMTMPFMPSMRPRRRSSAVSQLTADDAPTPSHMLGAGALLTPAGAGGRRGSSFVTRFRRNRRRVSDASGYDSPTNAVSDLPGELGTPVGPGPGTSPRPVANGRAAILALRALKASNRTPTHAWGVPRSEASSRRASFQPSAATPMSQAGGASCFAPWAQGAVDDERRTNGAPSSQKSGASNDPGAPPSEAAWSRRSSETTNGDARSGNMSRSSVRRSSHGSSISHRSGHSNRSGAPPSSGSANVSLFSPQSTKAAPSSSGGSAARSGGVVPPRALSDAPTPNNWNSSVTNNSMPAPPIMIPHSGLSAALSPPGVMTANGSGAFSMIALGRGGGLSRSRGGSVGGGVLLSPDGSRRGFAVSASPHFGGGGGGSPLHLELCGSVMTNRSAVASSCATEFGYPTEAVLNGDIDPPLPPGVGPGTSQLGVCAVVPGVLYLGSRRQVFTAFDPSRWVRRHSSSSGQSGAGSMGVSANMPPAAMATLGLPQSNLPSRRQSTVNAMLAASGGFGTGSPAGMGAADQSPGLPSAYSHTPMGPPPEANDSIPRRVPSAPELDGEDSVATAERSASSAGVGDESVPSGASPKRTNSGTLNVVAGAAPYSIPEAGFAGSAASPLEPLSAGSPQHGPNPLAERFLAEGGFLCVAKDLVGQPFPPGAKDNGCFLPLADNAETRLLDHLPAVFTFINENAKLGRPVVLYCVKGKSRSVSFALAYLMWFWRIESVDTALALLRRAYKEADPNTSFMIQLASLTLDDLDACASAVDDVSSPLAPGRRPAPDAEVNGHSPRHLIPLETTTPRSGDEGRAKDDDSPRRRGAAAHADDDQSSIGFSPHAADLDHASAADASPIPNPIAATTAVEGPGSPVRPKPVSPSHASSAHMSPSDHRTPSQHRGSSCNGDESPTMGPSVPTDVPGPRPRRSPETASGGSHATSPAASRSIGFTTLELPPPGTAHAPRAAPQQQPRPIEDAASLEPSPRHLRAVPVPAGTNPTEHLATAGSPAAPYNITMTQATPFNGPWSLRDAGGMASE
uniref:Tyrosine specific protein phosphatases domain-containing protein n=1 Tax=Neobodo designis TaxID=312471 RepID=A0A7S1QNW3_NEODS|mmetsp:Transcript_49541/g.152908  ORF Transcript_49541/g.152908 Transcript_49541/m.152908 type:complete len:1354 (+) Transcript_49541:138-4199(+)|eukprot:CAMPEP_0174841682 /NCGR_PEP_ID=MMETSP1114-20130205/9467_1 /TAXON_ID=312471 /ORGANISM="Neobodo designis, Strain CCAP 1951/1" /LENGTH=1353 /DNA_ID=CAMNT_0016075875 /DNA_START=136 /DNA_END=4197 /DNA_ORIENTATION=+